MVESQMQQAFVVGGAKQEAASLGRDPLHVAAALSLSPLRFYARKKLEGWEFFSRAVPAGSGTLVEVVPDVLACRLTREAGVEWDCRGCGDVDCPRSS